ncbi:MAG: ATP-binding cassette domain-containing protein [Bacillota bacterium]|jgi:tungstate transport system ATP-binding protein
MNKIIEIKDLTWVQQGRTILNIPHFYVESEEAVSIMGPNGAGKSSLLFIMAGLQKQSTGTINLFGKNVSEFSPLELHRRVAVVFQKPMMLDLTVMENLELGLRFRGIKSKEREIKIEPWLEKMRLTHLVKRRARSLSGGEAQRVSIAQALVVDPEIIFLDEPFANLDKEIRQDIMEEIRQLLIKQKITTVMVTHHRMEAVKMTDSIYYLEDGEILNREYLT